MVRRGLGADEWQECLLPSSSCHTGGMPSLTPPTGRSVAVLALDQVSPFELSVACEVFGMDRSPQGIPGWDTAVCASEPGPVATRCGFAIDTPYGLERIETADVVVLPSWFRRGEAPAPEVLAALRRAADRGAWILGFCSGSFVLAHAGLLDGQRATTHWLFTAEFRERFPAVQLDPGVLYVADGPVMTSAGTAAAIDLSLHVVRVVDGPEVANAVARRMVVSPHRDGGQAQYVERPIPAEQRPCPLSDLLTWMAEHLEQELSVDQLAARMHLSPRTFARRFRAETGTTPHHWLTGQRVLLAQRLLETTDLAVERIAVRCGFGSPATLRHHFASWVGVSPQRYRDQFRPAALSA
jgi:transcriptional regulator GlxA family with amidase domain